MSFIGFLKKYRFYIFIFILIFYSAILPWYTIKYQTAIPTKDKLYKEVGTLNYKSINAREGYLIGITSAGKTEYFTCKSPAGKRNDCLKPSDFHLLEISKGQPATVLWYKQKGDVGSFNRLASLEVNNKVWVSLEETEKHLESERRGIDKFTFFELIFMGLAIYAVRKVSKMKKLKTHQP